MYIRTINTIGIVVQCQNNEIQYKTWNGLNKLIINYLEVTRLQDLAQKQKQINMKQAAGMFYI